MASAIPALVIALVVTLTIVAVGLGVAVLWESAVWLYYKARGWQTKGRFDSVLVVLGDLLWLVSFSLGWYWGVWR